MVKISKQNQWIKLKCIKKSIPSSFSILSALLSPRAASKSNGVFFFFFFLTAAGSKIYFGKVQQINSLDVYVKCVCACMYCCYKNQHLSSKWINNVVIFAVSSSENSHINNFIRSHKMCIRQVNVNVRNIFYLRLCLKTHSQSKADYSISSFNGKTVNPLNFKCMLWAHWPRLHTKINCYSCWFLLFVQLQHPT